MEKKGTKIAYFIALAIVVIALVIAKVTNDGSGFVATGWALFPPVVAIALALISKEVYSSLFLGCLAGALLLANFDPWQMVVNFVGAGEGVGMINAIDISILIFLVMLGVMVDLMNKAGGSAAFGRWASTPWSHSRFAAEIPVSARRRPCPHRSARKAPPPSGGRPARDSTGTRHVGPSDRSAPFPPPSGGGCSG